MYSSEDLEMEVIKAELREERSKRKKAEAKTMKLDQQLKYAQKNKFGDKRQNARKDEKSDFFKYIFNGCRDFFSLTSSNIGLSSI